MNSRAKALYNELIKIMTPNTAFACIGAVKTTSYIDSIGPQVGDRLVAAGLPYVYGTHRKPYNGLTAETMAARIKRKHKNNLVIAIDTCTTRSDDKLLKIDFVKGSIAPGAGLDRKLPRIGDYSIKAYMLKEGDTDIILNSSLLTSGRCDFYVNEVNDIIDIISSAIIEAYKYVSNETIRGILPDNTNNRNVSKLL